MGPVTDPEAACRRAPRDRRRRRRDRSRHARRSSPRQASDDVMSRRAMVSTSAMFPSARCPRRSDSRSRPPARIAGPVFIGVEISQVEDGGPFGITSNDCPRARAHARQLWCAIALGDFHPLVQGPGPRSATLVVNGPDVTVAVSVPSWLGRRGGEPGRLAGWRTRRDRHTRGTAAARLCPHRAVGLPAPPSRLRDKNRVGGKWVSDSGKHAGIYYLRSATGSTWSAPKRLNPSTQHAARLGLAAAGSRVYVTWVSQTKPVKCFAVGSAGAVRAGQLRPRGGDGVEVGHPAHLGQRARGLSDHRGHRRRRVRRLDGFEQRQGQGRGLA